MIRHAPVRGLDGEMHQYGELDQLTVYIVKHTVGQVHKELVKIQAESVTEYLSDNSISIQPKKYAVMLHEDGCRCLLCTGKVPDREEAPHRIHGRGTSPDTGGHGEG